MYIQFSNSHSSYRPACTADKHITTLLFLLLLLRPLPLLLSEKVVKVEHSEMNECCTLAALCSVILLFSPAACLFSSYT